MKDLFAAGGRLFPLIRNGARMSQLTKLLIAPVI